MGQGQPVELPEILQTDVQVAGYGPHGLVAVVVGQIDPRPLAQSCSGTIC